MIVSIQRPPDAAIPILRPSIRDHGRVIVGIAARLGWNIGDSVIVVLNDGKAESHDLMAGTGGAPFTAKRMT